MEPIQRRALTPGYLAGVVWVAIVRLRRHNGQAIAGDLAFTILLALFPFLIFASSLAGYFGEQVDTEIVVEQVLRFAPPVVAESLVPAIEHAVGARSGSAALLGMVLGLVFAAMGVEAFRGALNTAFECHGLRPWWWRIIVNLLFVVVGSIGFLAATLVAVVWPVAAEFIPALAPLEGLVLSGPLRYVEVALLLAIMATAFYRWLPDSPPSLRHALPGAIVSAVLWLVAAATYAAYARTLARYALVYGSLAGVIVTLVFFYVSALTFVFGAELNAANAEARGEHMRDA